MGAALIRPDGHLAWAAAHADDAGGDGRRAGDARAYDMGGGSDVWGAIAELLRWLPSFREVG